MSTYQDVVNASLPLDAWALVEASGTDFAPYTGALHLTGAGVTAYQQAGPFAAALSIHLANGCLFNSTPFSGAFFWTMEAWFNPDSTTRPGNAILLYDGSNSAANGWGLYIPTGSNLLRVFYASPANDVSTGVSIPASAWSLLQIGNLSGSQGEISVALNGQIIAKVVDTASLTQPSAGFGFGRAASSPAANYSGSISMPAIYNNQQTPLSWYSRFQAATDPNTAILNTLTGPAANGVADSATLAAILAAVRRTF